MRGVHFASGFEATAWVVKLWCVPFISFFFSHPLDTTLLCWLRTIVHYLVSDHCIVAND